MKLLVLGKYGPFESASGGVCNCYLVSGENTRLLLDMGPGSLGRVQRAVDIKAIDAIYISHLHFDHTADLLSFRYLLDVLNHKVKIYAPLDNSPYCNVLFDSPRFEVIDTNQNKNFTVGEFNCTLVKTNHPVTNYGIRISSNGKTLVYTGDTAMCEELTELLSNADLAVGDFSKAPDFKGFHLTVNDAKDLASKLNIKILASHITPTDAKINHFKGCKNIKTAKEWKTYKI